MIFSYTGTSFPIKETLHPVAVVVVLSILLFIFTKKKIFDGAKNTTITHVQPPYAKNCGYLQALKAFSSKDILKILLQWSRETGRIYQVKLRLPGTSMVVVSTDTGLTRQILNDKTVVKSKLATVLKVFHDGGDSIVQSDGAFWKHSRRGMSPAFSSKHVERMNKITMAKVESFVENELEYYATTGKSCDMKAAIMDITLPIICEAALEYKVSSEEKKMYNTEVNIILRHLITSRVPFKWKSDAKRVKEASRKMVAFGFNILESYRKLESPQEGTAIDLIVKNENYKNDKERVNDILILINGGWDTTAVTLTWALFELAMNPSEQMKLQNELRASKPEERHELRALHNVIKESMRLRPVFPMLSRVVTSDTVVKRTEMNGLEMDMKIPKGATVILPLLLTNRDSKVFEDADEFKPSRWVNPTQEALGAALTFGLGKRNCIGRPLAMAQVKNSLAKFCADYTFTIDKEGSAVHDVTYHPNGMRLFVSKA